MNLSKRSVVLLGGGTGGHIFPLVSLKKALEKRGFSEFFWIGEGESLEERTAAKERIPFYAIKSGKLRRYLSFKTLVEPLHIALGFFQSLALLREIRPEFVFSKGGYVSLPAAMAAKVLRIPTYLHESDAIPGLANRLVGRFSKTVFLGFSQAAKYFPKDRTVVVGQLLNPDVDWGAIRNSRVSDLWPSDSAGPSGRGPGARAKSPKPGNSVPRTLKVFVICGSLGSSRIFEAVLIAAKALPDISFEVALGTLNAEYRAKFAPLENVICHDFLSQSEMASAYERADLAITRAGATTMGELEAAGCPMLIIPLEGSANDHQKANAEAYAAKGEKVLFEKDLNRLSEELSKLFLRQARSDSWKISPSLSGVRGIVEILCPR